MVAPENGHRMRPTVLEKGFISGISRDPEKDKTPPLDRTSGGPTEGVRFEDCADRDNYERKPDGSFAPKEGFHGPPIIGYSDQEITCGPIASGLKVDG